MEKFDYNKYVILYSDDLIPDTNLSVISDHDRNLWIIDKSKLDDLEKYKYNFEGVAVTCDYYYAAQKIKDEYLEVKSYNDGIRSDDEQYDDPQEWDLYDEYSKYFKEGLWSSDTYWDYCL